jgi:SAM-dependent methyltransferase
MEPTDDNRRAWDEIHRSRAEAMAGHVGIPDGIRALLPDLAGKHVLHLLCATGESTAQLVELGALVSAVDISSEALEIAREKAPDVAYVHADVHELPLELRRSRFDVVYSGGGVLPLLRDLDAWANGIVTALKPGGLMFFYDDHPVTACLDALGHWRDDYFHGSAEERERHWQLGQIIDAVSGAGLAVKRIVEFQTLYSWPQRDRRVPWDFALLAERVE